MAVREELLRNIRSVEPYVPGEQPQHKVVKLNTNENPYPPAPGVERVLKEMDTDRFACIRIRLRTNSSEVLQIIMA